MDDVARACSLALAAVFVAAAVAKGLRRQSTRDSFAALGLPLPGALAVAVPIVELVLVRMLLVSPAAGGVASLVLLAAFTAVVVRAIARGTDAPCACFGSARREPVSGVEIVRNAMLMALAVVATGASSARWPGLAAVIAVSVAVAIGRVALGLADLRKRTGHLWPGVPS